MKINAGEYVIGSKIELELICENEAELNCYTFDPKNCWYLQLSKVLPQF